MSGQGQRNKFEWMECVLAYDHLTAAQKNVAIRIALHRNSATGRCDPSVPTLAKGTSMKDRGVQIAISAIESSGYLKVIKRGGRQTNAFELAFPGSNEAGVTSPGVHGGAPLSRDGGVHDDASKGAPNCAEGCTVVHPNNTNKKNRLPIRNRRDDHYDALRRHSGRWRPIRYA